MGRVAATVVGATGGAGSGSGGGLIDLTPVLEGLCVYIQKH